MRQHVYRVTGDSYIGFREPHKGVCLWFSGVSFSGQERCKELSATLENFSMVTDIMICKRRQIQNRHTDKRRQVDGQRNVNKRIETDKNTERPREERREKA